MNATIPVRGSSTAVVVPLTEKVTVPVGVPVASTGLTVAVNVTPCPTTDGLGALSTTVVEPGCRTVTVTGPAGTDEPTTLTALTW